MQELDCVLLCRDELSHCDCLFSLQLLQGLEARQEDILPHKVVHPLSTVGPFRKAELEDLPNSRFQRLKISFLASVDLGLLRRVEARFEEA